MTIIYSHASNENLSNVYPILISLSTVLKCDVIGYDYSGYGQSTGTPNALEISRDIYEVCHFCSSVLKKPKISLVLYSYSNGATPNLYLACHPNYKHIGGIILLSPILNINFKSNIVKEYYEDNINKIEKIKIPMIIIQGKKDELCDWEGLSYKLKDKSNIYTWFPRNGNHYNIFELYRSNLIIKLRTFLDELQIKKFSYLNRESRSSHTLLNIDKDSLLPEQLKNFKTEKDEYLIQYNKERKNSSSSHIVRSSYMFKSKDENDNERLDDSN